MAVLDVGAGAQYQHIEDAINAAQPGDTIDVQAGTYNDEYFTVDKPLTIEAVNGTVTLTSDQQIPNGKAEAIVDANLTISGFEFSGAKVADGNGAGIRYEAGNLVVDHCYFYNDQDGILGGPSASGTVVVKNSEFSHDGAGDGYTHALYIGDIASLTVEDSYFHDTPVGHYIKSRAESTLVENNRIVDGATGTSSYNIDVPDGGATVIKDNVIEQGPGTQNPAMIHFGGETSTPYANSSLLVEGNTILNDYGSAHAAVGILNQTSTVAQISGNHFWGLTPSEIASGPNAQSGNDYLASEPSVDTSSPWQTTSTSPAPAPASSGSGASTPPAPPPATTGSAPVAPTPASTGPTPYSGSSTGSGTGPSAGHGQATSPHHVATLPTHATGIGESWHGALFADIIAHVESAVDESQHVWLAHALGSETPRSRGPAMPAAEHHSDSHGIGSLHLFGGHELTLAELVATHVHAHPDFFLSH